MQEINRNMVINIIKEYETYKAEIEGKIAGMEKEIFLLERTVTVDAAYPDQRARAEEKEENESGKPSDLSLLLLRKQKLEERHLNDMTAALVQLYDYRGMLERVMLCYGALPPEQKDVLNRLYQQGIKWAAMGMSSTKIKRRRDEGISMILELYHSDRPDGDLMNMVGLFRQDKELRIETQAEKEIPGQMGLFDVT